MFLLFCLCLVFGFCLVCLFGLWLFIVDVLFCLLCLVWALVVSLWGALRVLLYVVWLFSGLVV